MLHINIRNATTTVKTKSKPTMNKPKNTLTKKATELPLHIGLNESNIVIVETNEQLAEAISTLNATAVIGFDTETKPNFVKGSPITGPNLIQLSTEEKAYLFPVTSRIDKSKVDLPTLTEALKLLLESTTIKKVGFGLGDDKKLLKANMNIEVKYDVDLSAVLRPADNKNMVSAKDCVAMVLKKKFVKDNNVAKSNWAREIRAYTVHQKVYAANAANVALVVFEKWNKLQEKKAEQTVPTSTLTKGTEVESR